MKAEIYKSLNWHKQYEKLVAFINENERFPHYREGFGVGKWLSRQRGLYRSGKLSNEQVKLLNKIGIVWEYDSARREIKNGKDEG